MAGIVQDTRFEKKPTLQIASDCTVEWQSASKVTLVNKFDIMQKMNIRNHDSPQVSFYHR